MEYDIDPCPKPRMTKRDKWDKRHVVAKYWAFKEECRLKGVILPEDGAYITFVVSMPKSWSEKRKREFDGKHHKQKPDIDNLLKGLLDAVYDDDSRVSSLSVKKVWGRSGRIVIR